MKKQIVSTLLALCMLLCLMPTAAFAEESTETPPVCSCETACTAESRNTDCPVCGAEGALPENCEKCARPADDAAAQPEGEVSDPQPEKEVSDPQPETALTTLIGGNDTLKEVNSESELTNAIADSTVGTVKLAANIDIGSSLTVNRAVTLDLNGKVLQMTGSGSVIKVESSGNLTLTDSNTAAEHKFMPGTNGLWVLNEASGTEIVTGGVITGGTGYPYQLSSTVNCGGGVYIAPGGQLTMTGGNIIGCSAKYGGGVCIYPKQDSKQGQFSMSGGSIIGCSAESGGGVCAFGKFQMLGSAVIRSCTAEGTSFYFGGGVWVDGSFEMSGEAIIEGCQAISEYAYGGGVYVNSSSSFVMSGKAKIERCQAISTPSSPSKGGGVHLANNTTLTLSGSAVIQNCTATNSANSGEAYGGGVSAANVREITLADSASIASCTAANGSGLYITGSSWDPNVYGQLYANGGLVDGDVVLGEANNPCTVIGSGETVFNGKVTVTPGSTIEKGIFNGEVINNGTINGGTFNGTVNNNGTINDGTFNGEVTNNGTINDGTFNTPITGSGTKDDPYQISTAAQLKRFRNIVNGTGGQTPNSGACAVLTNDIVLNDGTFAENGNYTPGPSGAALTEWSPMGVSNSTVYAGTFDGAGHTIQGLYRSANKSLAGLFGLTNGATIKNVKVTGYLGSAKSAGGIAAHTEQTTITGCVNAATVNAYTGGQESIGGIVGTTELSSQIIDCINIGVIKCQAGDADPVFAGGIAGYLSSDSTISSCSNGGKVIGACNGNGSYCRSQIGGIVGIATLGTITDCYNAGSVTDITPEDPNSEPWVGGIVGSAPGHSSKYLSVTISNCYSTGSVTANNTTAKVGGITGNAENIAITNCYYLTGTAGQVCGKSDTASTVTNTTEKSAFDFANGGVLALLMANRPADAQPWDTTCKYLESAGMTLPVLARQNLTVHAHVWSTYTADTAAKTHTRSCACGVAKTEACTITPATCKDGSACAVCGQQYGGPDTGKHTDLQHFPAVAATTDAEGNKEYWYCGGCGKYFADAAATREITRADTMTAKLPQPTTPPTATPTAAPTTAPQAAEQPRRTAQPTVQPTAAPTVQPISTIPATGDTSSPILWAALLLCGGAGLAVTAYKKNRHRS